MEHNERTLEQVEQFVSKHQDCCVVNPCGSGKTSVMAAFIKNHIDKTFVIITKQKNAANYYVQRDPIFSNTNIKIRT